MAILFPLIFIYYDNRRLHRVCVFVAKYTPMVKTIIGSDHGVSPGWRQVLLSEPTLVCSQLKPLESISVKFETYTYDIHDVNCGHINSEFTLVVNNITDKPLDFLKGANCRSLLPEILYTMKTSCHDKIFQIDDTLWRKPENAILTNNRVFGDLTHPPLMPHKCVSELGQHWFG